MSNVIFSKLIEEKKSIEKNLESMEKYSLTDEFTMSLDEEKDMFHEHFEALINLRDKVISRIEYISN